jgi:hypothetical protein
VRKNQIKAELRRSATEDENPWWWHGLNGYVFAATCAFRNSQYERMCNLSNDDLRTFYLLVAEAL